MACTTWSAPRALLRPVIVAALALTVPVATVIAAAGPAQADTGSWSDSRDRGLALDIRKVRLANNQNRVNVQIKLNEFNSNNAERGGSLVWFDVDPSRSGPEFVASGGLGQDTDWSFARVRNWRMTELVHQCNLSLSKNFASDSIRWSLGRGCFDGRRGMRVGAEVSRYNPDFTQLKTDYSPSQRRLHGWIGRG